MNTRLKYNVKCALINLLKVKKFNFFMIFALVIGMILPVYIIVLIFSTVNLEISDNTDGSVYITNFPGAEFTYNDLLQIKKDNSFVLEIARENTISETVISETGIINTYITFIDSEIADILYKYNNLSDKYNISEINIKDWIIVGDDVSILADKENNKLFIAGREYNIAGYTSGRTILPFDDDDKLNSAQLYVKFKKNTDYEKNKNELQEYIFDKLNKNINLVSDKNVSNSSILNLIKSMLGALAISLLTVFYSMLYLINIAGIKAEKDRRDYAIKLACGATWKDIYTQGFIQQIIYCTVASVITLLLLILNLIILDLLEVIKGIEYLLNPLVLLFIILSVMLLCFIIAFINSRAILKKAAKNKINEILR